METVRLKTLYMDNTLSELLTNKRRVPVRGGIFSFLFLPPIKYIKAFYDEISI